MRTFAIICIVIVFGITCFRVHVSSAHRRWESVGGTVSWNEDFFWGARRIGIGGAIGNGVSRDLEQINFALQKINRLPLCNELVINCSEFREDSPFLPSLLKGCKLTHLCLTSYRGGLTELENAIQICHCQKLTLIKTQFNSLEMQELVERFSTIELVVLDAHRKKVLFSQPAEKF